MSSKDFARIVRPGEGVQIVDDVTDQFGLDTIEGKIGPLIQGIGTDTYFLDMPPDAYLEEHPHSFEAVVYVVRGRSVFVTRGERHVMEPGSLLWFAPDIPTGYEVPFDEPSLLLVFRNEVTLPQDEFVERLKSDVMSQPVALLSDLPEDHPARVFAASLKENE